MSALLDAYRSRFKIAIAVQFQYRVALIIWLTWTIMESVIYLVVWSTVARSSGGQAGDFGVRDFAAYFIAVMLVNHLTFTWIMHEFEFRIRQGQLSPLLLKPLHPIHGDIAENLTYKALTLVVLLPATLILAVIFNPAFNTQPWAALAFVPALVLAFFVRFLTGWALALAGFWTTRTMAINQLYFVPMTFLSGQMVPLSLLPEPLQVVATVLPFRWMVSFPVELVLGRLTPTDTIIGLLAQTGWVVASIAIAMVVWRAGLKRYSAVGA